MYPTITFRVQKLQFDEIGVLAVHKMTQLKCFALATLHHITCFSNISQFGKALPVALET